MLAPSSPIAFPSSPPPAISKRPRATDAPNPPRPRAVGGFLADDDSDDDATPAEPSPKRRMLENDAQDAPRPHKSRTLGGFLADDSEDDDAPAAQSPIRRTLAAHSQDSLLAATKHVHLDPMDTTATPPDSQLDTNPDDEAERQSHLFGSQNVDFSASWASQSRFSAPAYRLTTCSGKSLAIRERKVTETVSYETIIAARSKTKEGRAKKSYYGIDIHELMDDATKQIDEARKEAAAHPITPPANPDTPVRTVEDHHTNSKKMRRGMLWTEKYRARTFMDLVGDDLTNRQVLRWLKRWDPIVFPHATKTKSTVRRPGQQQNQQPEEERPHRKILMLTGPPGLGKTTLAHVCARQAGYEVMEINASDDRSKDVVKGRIRTSLGTETVKTVSHKKPEPGKPQKVAHPVCVIVDEVDGVVSGSGGSGEGGFVRALIDLIMLDQKNSPGALASSGTGRRKKKGDDFRQMRPLILICNDVYHPSLRPLRQSGLAEIIHVGKPSVEAVVTRLKSVFEKEGIPCEKDAARKLCEAAWGITSGIDTRKGLESNAEGDLRGVMVVGEWVAGRLKAASKDGTPCLTRQWLEKNIVHDLAHGGGGARGIGRGGTKEIATRVFQEGAGFPKQAAATAQPKNTSHEQPQAQLGFSEQQKKYAMSRLREMIETSGEVDRIMTEVFAEYPTRDFNDDSFLTKPDSAYEWMHFHDACSSRIFSSQEWELAPYVSQPILACHQLFATSRRHQPQNNYDRKWGDAADEPDEPPLPFSGPRADFAAFEAGKLNRAALQGIQGQLPPSLNRAFRSPEHIATDFLPYLVRLVSPDVKPVVVGGTDKLGSIASVRREGEKAMVRRAALVLDEVGIALLKGKIEADPAAGPATRTQWVYRMEPDLDALATFETAGALVLATQAPTRYAVRQVLDLELQKAIALRETAARQARFQSGSLAGVHEDYVFSDKENKAAAQKMLTEREKMVLARSVKRDFFGRLIVEKPRPLGETDGNAARGKAEGEGKIWVTYHEGLNEAVRKPISLEEFMRGL
ncbi:hypothetical protein B0T22DRAFT_439629 [Podospora appendiculata]|uniref:AAA+ ATPase domain-containing protein n=1 Tax=Podospora appendiculata TaxID=314037 RepID=A0AAE0X9A8_9PEZI|nr:hypothetical protein B0T22DRAFT_439629 [Podospora appendiculata]